MGGHAEEFAFILRASNQWTYFYVRGRVVATWTNFSLMEAGLKGVKGGHRNILHDVVAVQVGDDANLD